MTMLTPSQSLSIFLRLHQCSCNKLLLCKWCLTLPFLRACFLAKPAMIALCAVAGVVVLALLTVIIVCSMHKKKISGKGSVSNGN